MGKCSPDTWRDAVGGSAVPGADGILFLSSLEGSFSALQLAPSRRISPVASTCGEDPSFPWTLSLRSPEGVRSVTEGSDALGPSYVSKREWWEIAICGSDKRSGEKLLAAPDPPRPQLIWTAQSCGSHVRPLIQRLISTGLGRNGKHTSVAQS